MRCNLRFLLYIILFAAMLATASRANASDTAAYKDGDVIMTDTTWQGDVLIDGVILVPAGVTLTIKPGCSVRFRKSSASYKEQGDIEAIIPGSGIRVEGKVVAIGDKAGPISFTSAEANPSPGDWGCIFIDHTKGSVFRRCRFEFSAYTIHAHFSTLEISRCLITHNQDGSRLGVSRATIDHCDIIDNTGKGLNFWQAKVNVSWCNISGNQDGIFLNEKDTGCVIEYNNFTKNNMDLRLGDFHSEDIALNNNWWGGTDVSSIKEKVFDRDDDAEVGLVAIQPMAAEVAGAGVDGPEFGVKWRFTTGGFVDCNPAVADGVVYFGSWDKKFYAVKEGTGELVWSFEALDCIDSSPAIVDGMVYFGSWDRNVYCLDGKNGKLVWKFLMEPSNFDDHRQSSPAVMDGHVFIGGFNGNIYALDAGSGKLATSFQTDGPIRSKPQVIKENGSIGIVVGSGDGSLHSLSFINNAFKKEWSFKADGAINSSAVVSDGRIYIGSRSGKVYCLDRSGMLLWENSTAGGIEYSSPYLTDKRIVIGSTDHKLYAFRCKDGMPDWKYSGEGVIYSTAVTVSNRTVFGDNKGDIIMTCGDRLAAIYKAGDAVQGISVGPDGTIYAGSRDGNVYALDIKE